MPRKRPKSLTEREALKMAADAGKRIEALTPRAMTYAAARKRAVAKDGFLIYDEDSGRYVPAVLVEPYS